MRDFLILFLGCIFGTCIALVVLGLCFAARDKKPPKKPPLIIKQDSRVKTVSAFLFVPKKDVDAGGWHNPHQYLAEKIGWQLLDDGLLEIHAAEGKAVEGTFYNAFVRVVKPTEKEANDATE